VLASTAARFATGRLVRGLRDSWDDDAFVRDKASGRCFDPQYCACVRWSRSLLLNRLGYETPDTTGARLSPEAPEGTTGAAREMAPNKISKTGFGFKRRSEKFSMPTGRQRFRCLWRSRHAMLPCVCPNCRPQEAVRDSLTSDVDFRVWHLSDVAIQLLDVRC
jgi:hypothetical protein